MNIIDLRSDTVTKPSKEMRKAMYDAEVGDDVFKEDPSVNALEEYSAEIFGKEAALFVPTGVMGNQICLNILTNPGDEVICESKSHILNYESGSASKLSGVQLLGIEGENGILNPAAVENAVRPEYAYYMPKTKLIVLENTHNSAGGIVQPIENIIEIKGIAKKHGLFYHLDGARIWNAHIVSKIPLSGYAMHFDSVSCCLSKGLGAPVGSIILGNAEFIKEAFRVRKSFGGGMRQAGIIAAAGLFALKNNIERLYQDHENAKVLAEFISNIPSLEIDINLVQTNIILFRPKSLPIHQAAELCRQEGLLFSIIGDSLRAITHLNLSSEDIDSAKNILRKVFS